MVCRALVVAFGLYRALSAAGIAVDDTESSQKSKLIRAETVPDARHEEEMKEVKSELDELKTGLKSELDEIKQSLKKEIQEEKKETTDTRSSSKSVKPDSDSMKAAVSDEKTAPKSDNWAVHEAKTVFRDSEFGTGIGQIEYELNHKAVKTSKVKFAILAQFFFFAVCGCDRCLVGQLCLGALKGITGGGFLIWFLIDYIVVFMNMMRSEKAINSLYFNAQFGEKSEIVDAYWVALLGLMVSIPSLSTVLYGIYAYFSASKSEKDEKDESAEPAPADATPAS